MDGMKISDDELTGASPPAKNWRGILIATLVIAMVISLITIAIILVSPDDDKTFKGKPFTFDDMFSTKYHTKSFSATWSKVNDSYTYRSRQGQLMHFDPVTNKTRVLMTNNTFRRLNTDSYSISSDLKYVLLRTERISIYRHSFTAFFKIVSLDAKDDKSRVIEFPRASNNFWEGKRIQYAKWSPTGHSLSFVYGNNLYYQESPTSNAVRLSYNGLEGSIYNGVADWLYEEEIFQSTVSHWWSPDSQKVLYAEIDDNAVPVYEFSYYGGPNDIYGSIKKIHYPKAGTKGHVIPKIKLILVNIDEGHTRVTLRPPQELINSEYYVTMVSWHSRDSVIVSWSNRIQNYSIYTLCNVTTAICSTNFEQRVSEGKGWVDIAYPFSTGDPNSYLIILPQRDGTSGYWNHIAKVSLTTGNKEYSFVTNGKYEVTRIVGYNRETKRVYYISTNGDPRTRHLFSVEVGGVYTPVCMSCDAGLDCLYVGASMSSSSHYYLQQCMGPGVPTVSLRSTIDGRDVTMEDNSVLKRRLENKAVLRPNYYKLTIDGETIYAEVRLPHILNKKQNKIVYPVMISTYGGPSSQSVNYRFKLGWAAYLTSSRNTIVIKIDGRGSGARGQRFMHKIYRQLGTYEIQDQISGFKLLSEKLPYIDKQRVAVFGWSYGGYVAAMILADNSKVINCGLSVAPVTDWRLYDSAYTEKYMGLYSDNSKGYDSSKLSIRADNIVGKKIMVVHGTADDNVHFQNTAQFTRAMTKAGVDYRVHFYTDKHHGLRGRKTRRHLYRSLTNYMHKECWGGGKPRELGDGDEQPAVVL